MPYIDKNSRKMLDSDLGLPVSAGDLNYTLTRLVHHYVQRKGLCYTTLNEVIGVLECAKLGLYRKIAAPYEDNKCKENGPVSELDKEI